MNNYKQKEIYRRKPENVVKAQNELYIHLGRISNLQSRYIIDVNVIKS